jgi:hypothetical protein
MRFPQVDEAASSYSSLVVTPSGAEIKTPLFTTKNPPINLLRQAWKNTQEKLREQGVVFCRQAAGSFHVQGREGVGHLH